VGVKEPIEKVYYSPTPLGIVVNHILILLRHVKDLLVIGAGIKQKTLEAVREAEARRIIYIPLMRVLPHLFSTTLILYMYIASTKSTFFTVELKSGRRVEVNIHSGFVAAFHGISLLVEKIVKEFGELIEIVTKTSHLEANATTQQYLEAIRSELRDFTKTLQDIENHFDDYALIINILRDFPRTLAKALKVHIEEDVTS